VLSLLIRRLNSPPAKDEWLILMLPFIAILFTVSGGNAIIHERYRVPISPWIYAVGIYAINHVDRKWRNISYVVCLIVFGLAGASFFVYKYAA
jgi:hypothetical protein